MLEMLVKSICPMQIKKANNIMIQILAPKYSPDLTFSNACATNVSYKTNTFVGGAWNAKYPRNSN